MCLVMCDQVNQCVCSGVIKVELGTYDLLFYIAIAAALYVSLATVAIIFCMRHRLRASKSKAHSWKDNINTERLPLVRWHSAYF